MTVRKALVLVGGKPQQLQPGDTLGGPVAENDTIQLTNGDVGAHALGDVVFISGSDTVKKAKADATATVPAFAVATAAIAGGAVGPYQTSGVVSGLAGLTPGASYFLSDAAAGGIVTAAPSTVGHYVQEIGQAVSATELSLDIGVEILL